VKLVVVCPGGAVTGGPEAMHQLVSTANMEEPGSAAILYWPFNKNHHTPLAYKCYDVAQVRRDDVPKSALVVLPEIWPEMAHTFPNRCALWWLSVDNFGTHGQRNIDRISLHLCQSEYAWQHVEPMGERMMLTDWVSIENHDTPRLPRVVVNPAKDAGLLRPFQATVGCEVLELVGLSRYGVTSALRGSTVYVDFGHHPGRDRLPREAALAGCIVFTTRHGAANFHEDMPMPYWYKFKTLDEVLEKVRLVVGGKTTARQQQDKYRAWVLEQRMWFESEVRALLSRIDPS